MPKTEKTTTIINNPPSDGSGGGLGLIIGLVVILVLAYLFWIYGLPAIRNMQGGTITPQINIPGKIDVNINQTK